MGYIMVGFALCANTSDELIQDLDRKMNRAEETNKEVAELERQKAASDKELAELEKDHTKNEKELAEIRKKMAEFKELERQRAASDKRIAEHEKEIAELEKKIAEKEQPDVAAKKKLIESVRQIAASDKEAAESEKKGVEFGKESAGKDESAYLKARMEYATVALEHHKKWLANPEARSNPELVAKSPFSLFEKSFRRYYKSEQFSSGTRYWYPQFAEDEAASFARTVRKIKVRAAEFGQLLRGPDTQTATMVTNILLKKGYEVEDVSQDFINPPEYPCGLLSTDEACLIVWTQDITYTTTDETNYTSKEKVGSIETLSGNTLANVYTDVQKSRYHSYNINEVACDNNLFWNGKVVWAEHATNYIYKKNKRKGDRMDVLKKSLKNIPTRRKR